MVFISNRRRYPRYPINLPVFIFYSEKRIIAHTLDVGPGGMKIHADHIFLAGQKVLFQLTLKGKSIWAKGRFIFAETQPDLVNFYCIQFIDITKEYNFFLKEYLSNLEKGKEEQVSILDQYKKEQVQQLSTFMPKDLAKEKKYIDTLAKKIFWLKECIELKIRIQEREVALAETINSLKIEGERLERGKQVFKDLEERLRYLSSEFFDYEEKKIELIGKEIHDRIEAMILAMTHGLKNIRILMKEGKISDQISFEQIIFNIQNNYKEIQGDLEKL